MDLTAQEWDGWGSRWAQYKRYNRPTVDHKFKYLLLCDWDCVYNIWDCFSPEHKTAAYRLRNNNTIDKKQFLKKVRKLVVTHARHVSQPRQPATSTSHVSHQCQQTSPVTHTSHDSTATRQDLSHEVRVVKAAKEAEEETEIPKLGVNQTDQDWEKWQSSWAVYKHNTSLTDQRDYVYRLWGCFTRELERMARDEKLDKEADLDSPRGYYDKEVFVKAKQVQAKKVKAKDVAAKDMAKETSKQQSSARSVLFTHQPPRGPQGPAWSCLVIRVS